MFDTRRKLLGTAVHGGRVCLLIPADLHAFLPGEDAG